MISSRMEYRSRGCYSLLQRNGRHFRKTITLDFKFALELTYQKLGGYKFRIHYDEEASPRCFPNGGVSY